MSKDAERERDEPPPPANPEPFAPFPLLTTQRIYDSPWCGLRRDFVELPSGKSQEYHVFEIEDAVAVVPITNTGEIVMVGQYRYPHGKTHWEIPAGRIGKGESPAEGATRELLEETGYRPARLSPLPGFYPTNGISAHYAHAFVAEECEHVAAPQLDDSEQIIVRIFSRDEARSLLRAGRIEDGFTALTLLYYLLLHDRSAH